MRSILLAVFSILLLAACGGRDGAGTAPEGGAPMTAAQAERLLELLRDLQARMERLEADRWGTPPRDAASDAGLPAADWDALGSEERDRLAELLAHGGVDRLSDTEGFVLRGLLTRLLRRLPGESEADYEARSERWVADRVARLRRVFGAAADDPADPVSDIPGAGAWCGTPGGYGGPAWPGDREDWRGPDADGVWWRWRPDAVVRVLRHADGSTPSPGDLRAYGMDLGPQWRLVATGTWTGGFRVSDPGESREAFLARMTALKAKLEADAAHRAGRK